jgi:hypothetical protein
MPVRAEPAMVSTTPRPGAVGALFARTVTGPTIEVAAEEGICVLVLPTILHFACLLAENTLYGHRCMKKDIKGRWQTASRFRENWR